MKKLFAIAFIGLCVTQTNAQKIKSEDVPPTVKAAFMKAYPAVKDVTWDRENDLYEASFGHNKKDMSVLLDDSGAIKEVETEIEKGEFPIAIQNTLNKDYAGYKIEEAAKILSDGKITYEAEIEKGEKSFELIFDSNGVLLKKNEEVEKD